MLILDAIQLKLKTKGLWEQNILISTPLYLMLLDMKRCCQSKQTISYLGEYTLLAI